jgi:hypothetical protein
MIVSTFRLEHSRHYLTLLVRKNETEWPWSRAQPRPSSCGNPTACCRRGRCESSRYPPRRYTTPRKSGSWSVREEDTVLAAQGSDVDQNVTTMWKLSITPASLFRKMPALARRVLMARNSSRSGEDLLREPGHENDGKTPAKIHLGKLCQ